MQAWSATPSAEVSLHRPGPQLGLHMAASTAPVTESSPLLPASRVAGDCCMRKQCPPYSGGGRTAAWYGVAPSPVPAGVQQQRSTLGDLESGILDAVVRDDSAVITAAVQLGVSPETTLLWNPWRRSDGGNLEQPATSGHPLVPRTGVRRSLLCLAAFHGSVAVARCLLGLGANPLLASPDDGYTALHAAAEAGHENTIKLLLEHGADHEAVDCRGLRPLELQLLAAQRKHNEKLQQQQEQQRRAQAQHEPCQLSQEFLLSLRMRDMTTVVTDPSYDDFEVAVGPHVPDPTGGANSDISKPEFSTDHFRINCFKVLKCTKTHAHDWTECPFVHPGEKARRRSPSEFPYTSAACPDFRKGVCRRGDLCNFSHGVFECWLHPSRYRTQMCKDAPHCTRRVCFFAHSHSELRNPSSETHFTPPSSVSNAPSPARSPLACAPSSKVSLSPEKKSSLSNVAGIADGANALMSLLPAGTAQADHPIAQTRQQSDDAVTSRGSFPQHQLPAGSVNHGLHRTSNAGYSPSFGSPSWRTRSSAHLSPQSLAWPHQGSPQASYYPNMYLGSEHEDANDKGAIIKPMASSWLPCEPSADMVPSSRRSSEEGNKLPKSDGAKYSPPGYGGTLETAETCCHGTFASSSIGPRPVLKRCYTDNAKYDLPGSGAQRVQEPQVERSANSVPSQTTYNPATIQSQQYGSGLLLQPRSSCKPLPLQRQPHRPVHMNTQEDELNRVTSRDLLDVSWVESLTCQDNPGV